MKRIAIYGKGGIGKSTITSNISASLASQGYKVMQIGCDPKSDSTLILSGGKALKTVLESILEKAETTELSDIVGQSESGVLLVEAGGPRPGMGCAGRGIITAFEKLKELEAYEVFKPDIVLYDVLGDVVCGGFAMPIREGYADYVLIVTSGEKMSLYAANNILEAVRGLSPAGYAKLAGIVANYKNIENEREIIYQWAQERSVDILGEIERSKLIQEAENQSKTIVEKFPESQLATSFMELADKIKNL